MLTARTAREVAVSLIAAITCACAPPEIADRIPPKESTADLASTATTSAPPAASQPSSEKTSIAASDTPHATELGPAPANLRDSDWANASLPGEFCDVPGNVAFHAGKATATSQTWGPVHLAILTDPKYGDIDGDGQDEAAVPVYCDNGGGTASGELAFGYVVVRSADGHLELLGSVVPQYQPAELRHVALTAGIQFEESSLVAEEAWYRASDATCCPSGKAETRWLLRDGRLTPGTPVVTS